MNKGLEALEHLKDKETLNKDKKSLEALEYIEKELSIPTEEELCKRIKKIKERGGVKFDVGFSRKLRGFYTQCLFGRENYKKELVSPCSFSYSLAIDILRYYKNYYSITKLY